MGAVLRPVAMRSREISFGKTSVFIVAETFSGVF